MKIIHAQQDSRGNVFEQIPAGGVGRMRCMKCLVLVTPAILPDGTQVMRCTGCGASQQSASMDKPPGLGPNALPTKPAA